MLLGEAKLQGAETDSRGTADRLPPEPLFGYETLLSGVSALTPYEQSKHRYTCTAKLSPAAGLQLWMDTFIQ